MSKFYDAKYASDDFYWGTEPSTIARVLFEKYPPREGQRLLDVGCGEGRDSVFFAQNGYRVTAFDSSAEGVRKSKARARGLKLPIEFFRADINECRLEEPYDVIFASGALHYILPPLRQEVLANYKDHTAPGGLHAFTVPIGKPFLAKDPQADALEHDWLPAEILTYYRDWKVEYFTEEILDDKGGYKFPVNRLIARRPGT